MNRFQDRVGSIPSGTRSLRLSGYELTVARGGPILVSSRAGASAPEPQDAASISVNTGGPSSDKNGFPILPPGMRIASESSGGMMHVTFQKTSMAVFAQDLSRLMVPAANGRRAVPTHPVVDRTGLSGDFDFRLQFVLPFAEGAGSSEPDRDAFGDADARLNNIATAVTEQLGLSLRASKTGEEIIVIDHVERAPSEN